MTDTNHLHTHIYTAHIYTTDKNVTI